MRRTISITKLKRLIMENLPSNNDKPTTKGSLIVGAEICSLVLPKVYLIMHLVL